VRPFRIRNNIIEALSMARLTHKNAKSFMYMLGAGLCGLAMSPANAEGTSSFQRSCDHISVAGNALVATCRRVDGSMNRTSLVLLGIENIDGQLQLTGRGQPATFQDSCRHIRMDGGTLTATCHRLDHSDEQTSVDLPGISNINGNLQY
jgi:CVNH domain-containing protein